jgi:hypothetical protein
MAYIGKSARPVGVSRFKLGKSARPVGVSRFKLGGERANPDRHCDELCCFAYRLRRSTDQYAR